MLAKALMRRISMNNNRLNLEAALRTAEAGMSVFPVRAQKISGKRWNLSPVYPSGPRTATRNPDKIASWWDEHLNAIPAIPCTSFVVLDADQDFMGIDGVAALEALLAEQDWPSPPVVLTPNGKQYYFLQPKPPLGYHTGALPDGIDVRGLGGFVIAPGATLLDGTCWRVDESLPSTLIPELPGWLERIIRSTNC
jgi:bifunctional DNA primase/polymerase-like protein